VSQTETIFRSVWPQIFRRADAGVTINIAQDLARNAWTWSRRWFPRCRRRFHDLAIGGIGPTTFSVPLRTKPCFWKASSRPHVRCLNLKSTPQAADLRGFFEVAFMCNSPDW